MEDWIAVQIPSGSKGLRVLSETCSVCPAQRWQGLWRNGRLAFPKASGISSLFNFGRAGQDSLVEQTAAAHLSGVPINPEGLLNLPLWVCDKLCRFPSVSAPTAICSASAAASWSSAARPGKSAPWQALQSEFGVRLRCFSTITSARGIPEPCRTSQSPRRSLSGMCAG